MVYLDMDRKVSGQYSKPQGPKTSVEGGGGMTHLDPLLSLQPYQASHIFPGPTTFTKSEYGRLTEIVNSQKEHRERQSHDRGAPKRSYRMWHTCDHMITCLLGNVSHHLSSMYHQVYHHS
jgi:hypothetical protein